MEFPESKYRVVVLKDGYYKKQETGVILAGSSCALIIGPRKVLVNTGSPVDQKLILQGLQDNSVKPDDLDYVICCHANYDNVGNLSLFGRATQIVGFEICCGDKRHMHAFYEGIPYEIDDFVHVIPSPGCYSEAVTVLVTSTPLGTIAITGGTFFNEGDLENPELWIEQSRDQYSQQQSRIDILRLADFILPGYGPLFQVPANYRGSEMCVVMTP